MSGIVISRFEDVLQYGGQVLKYTKDGQQWHYTFVRNCPRIDRYQNAGEGIPADAEIKKGVHAVDPILRVYFYNRLFVLMTTTPDEVAGKRFSYQ
jgi:hypothetical protein